MSGIVGSRLNNRGSGLVGSLGTDGQVFTSSGAGKSAVYEASAGFDAASITGATDYGAIVPATDDTLVMYDTSATALREVTVAALGNTPSFKVKKTSSQGSLDDGNIKFTFTSAMWDSHSAWDTTNSKFVVPADCAGKYFFNLTAYVYNFPAGDVTDSQHFNVFFYVNGAIATDYSPSAGLRRTIEGANRESAWTVGMCISLDAADELEVYGSRGWAAGAPYHVYYSPCRFEGFRIAGV